MVSLKTIDGGWEQSEKLRNNLSTLYAHLRKQVNESRATIQDPGQSGRGSTGAGVVVVVVVVVAVGLWDKHCNNRCIRKTVSQS